MKRPDGDGQRSPGDVGKRIQLDKDAPGVGDIARSAAPQDDHCDPEVGGPGISPVSEECLATVESELRDEDHCTPQQRAMAENVARRRADHEIITALKARNFEGPLYDYFAAEQAAYALAVLMSWMRTGEIFRKCREKGRPVPSAEIWRWDRDDRLGLAHLTVTKALAVFRERGAGTGCLGSEARRYRQDVLRGGVPAAVRELLQRMHQRATQMGRPGAARGHRRQHLLRSTHRGCYGAGPGGRGRYP